MKKIICLFLLIIVCINSVFSLASCMPRQKLDPDTLSVCLASEPESLDPAKNSTSDGATMLCHLFSGLARWEKNTDGTYYVVPDMATELTSPETNADGSVTYTYVLREGLKWSDGKPLLASDIVFSWNRAASPELASDYGYMLEAIKGYETLWDKNDGGELAVFANDEKRELKVTLKNDLPYWNELLAFPVFFPVRSDVVSNEAWATNPKTYIGNGAYTMTEWAHDSVIKLTKNGNYIDRDDVRMQNIHFYLSDDTNNMLANFENRTWQFIDGVPIGEVDALRSDYADEFYLVPQLGTYYTIWNAGADLLPADSPLSGEKRELANAEIRKALSAILDRRYICDEIGKGGQIPATSFIPAGLSDFGGGEFYLNANKGEDGSYGYYGIDKKSLEAAAENARTVLKKYFKFDTASGKFTNVPTMTYLYNTSDAHRAVGEYIQSKFASLGITVRLSNREWATFLEARQNGDYTIARSGWLADYNDPIAFLDMWTTASENNDAAIGKNKHGGARVYSLDLSDLGMDEYNKKGATWSESYDLLIRLIKAERDAEKRYALMHKAEDLLMQTGCVTPLYYYTDMFMLNSAVKGFYSNPLGVKYFMYCTVEI